MVDEDISRLKIDRSKVAFQPRRRRRLVYWAFAALSLAVLAFLYIKGFFAPSVPVQVVTVSQIYPSQTFTVLNASGYVVPQRKSALAAKVTGRLIWLGVEEGSRVKKDQLVARLESEDVKAAKDQAVANVEAARFNLEQTKAELRDATLSFDRNKELMARGVAIHAGRGAPRGPPVRRAGIAHLRVRAVHPFAPDNVHGAIGGHRHAGCRAGPE